MVSEFVEVVNCETAEDFLQALSPMSTHFCDNPPYSWFFRGLERAGYDLVLSALRPGALQRIKVVEGETNKEQIASEFQLLKEFFEIADLRDWSYPKIRNSYAH
jgi:hypothetical protein